MHNRLIIASSQDKNNKLINAKEVTNQVYQWLDDEGFANQDGRWSSGPSDWFLVGGRWSGCLTGYKSGLDYEDYLKHAGTLNGLTTKEKAHLKIGAISGVIEKHRDKLQSWWEEKTNTNSEHPWLRNSYSDLGGIDDSQKLTKKLWNHFNTTEDSKFTYQSEESWLMIDRWETNDNKKNIDYDSETQWSELKGKWESTNPDEIWLTVIDYHY